MAYATYRRCASHFILSTWKRDLINKNMGHKQQTHSHGVQDTQHTQIKQSVYSSEYITYMCLFSQWTSHARFDSVQRESFAWQVQFKLFLFCFASFNTIVWIYTKFRHLLMIFHWFHHHCFKLIALTVL